MNFGWRDPTCMELMLYNALPSGCLPVYDTVERE